MCLSLEAQAPVLLEVATRLVETEEARTTKRSDVEAWQVM